MASVKSRKVPKDWEKYYSEMILSSDDFCARHLNQNYADLAGFAIAALCRKRPSPLQSGAQKSWVCAVLYALGQVNFLSDKSTQPSMTLAELCGHFGISSSTGGNKAKIVRTALGMDRFDHVWMLAGLLDSMPMAWLIEFDGFVLDARKLPRDLQQVLFQKGLIPYVHAAADGPADPESGVPASGQRADRVDLKPDD